MNYPPDRLRHGPVGHPITMEPDEINHDHATTNHPLNGQRRPLLTPILGLLGLVVLVVVVVIVLTLLT